MVCVVGLNDKTRYQVLGVQEGATTAEIDKAFRKLALRWHPDTGGDEERFKELSDAHDVLADKDLRADYDAQLRRVRAAGTRPTTASAQESPHGSPGPAQSSGYGYHDRATGRQSSQSWSYVAYGPTVASRPQATAVRQCVPLMSRVGRLLLVGPSAVAAMIWLSVLVRTTGLDAALFHVHKNESLALGAHVYSSTVPQVTWGWSLAVHGLELWPLYVIVYLPWAARSSWRAFPRWERAVLLVAVFTLMSTAEFVLTGAGVLVVLSTLATYIAATALLRHKPPTREQRSSTVPQGRSYWA